MTPLKGNPGGTILHIWYGHLLHIPLPRFPSTSSLLGLAKERNPMAQLHGLEFKCKLPWQSLLFSSLTGTNPHSIGKRCLILRFLCLSQQPAASRNNLFWWSSAYVKPLNSFLPPVLPKSTLTLTGLDNTITGASSCPQHVFNHCSNFTSAKWSATSSCLSLLFSSPTCASWWKARNEGKATTPLSGLILQSS